MASLDDVREMAYFMREVGINEIIPRYRKTGVYSKQDFRDFREIVTEADIESSKCILDSVRPKFPGSYSEEHIFLDRFDYEYIWQFDTLDGTNEFVRGFIDGCSMHCALLKRIKRKTWHPIAGIIYNLGLDSLWYGNEEKQHFIRENEEKTMPILERNTIRGYRRVVDSNDKIKQFYENLEDKLGLISKIIPGGGSGSSFSDLLEGKNNLIVMNYDYTKEWDISMAEPLIKSRGGFICNLSGKEFTYNRKDHFNREGYVASIVFKKEEIIPEIPDDLLIRRL